MDVRLLTSTQFSQYQGSARYAAAQLTRYTTLTVEKARVPSMAHARTSKTSPGSSATRTHCRGLPRHFCTPHPALTLAYPGHIDQIPRARCAIRDQGDGTGRPIPARLRAAA